MATQVSQQLTHANEYGANYGMARQAIINSNFSINQRGTSVTNPTNGTFLSDRYLITVGGGTMPTTIVHSIQLLTSGDILNSFYHYRIAPNGAGTSPVDYRLSQKIENGTRYLCGLNKKVTVSFYARSSIANKKIAVWLDQVYGTGGSPSSEELINGTNFTLTSTWTKYTYTFTTNTLVGKTFGTANDDYLWLNFQLVWTSGGYDTVSGAAGTNESFVGSGNIDIAQVQLCAGDTALPFQPKSKSDEEKDCKRYFQRNLQTRGLGRSFATNHGNLYIPFYVSMRIAPAITLDSSLLTAGIAEVGVSTRNITSVSIYTAYTSGVEVDLNLSAATTGNAVNLITDAILADAEL